MAAPGDLRTALSTQLAADLSVTFVPGMLVGPIEGRSLGSCYVQRITEVSGRVQEEEMLAIVRVFTAYLAPVDPIVPFDPTPLETLVATLQASIAAHQTGIGGTWFLRLAAVDIDLTVQGIEATIVARALNAGLS